MRYLKVLARYGLIAVCIVLGIAAFVVIRSELYALNTDRTNIEIPIAVHLVRNVDIKHSDVTLRNWVGHAQVADTLLPEVNRIWQQAGISWKLVRVEELRLNPGDVSDIKNTIMDAGRDGAWKNIRTRHRRLTEFSDQRSGASPRFHVFVLPYLGWLISGEAGTGENGKQYVFLGAWYDDVWALVEAKVQPRGIGALKKAIPVRRKRLTSKRRMESMAETMGNILGRDLGLYARTCAEGCLMGGTGSDGATLTAYQIGKARSRVNAVSFLVKLFDMIELLWLRIKWGWPKRICSEQGC